MPGVIGTATGGPPPAAPADLDPTPWRAQDRVRRQGQVRPSLVGNSVQGVRCWHICPLARLDSLLPQQQIRRGDHDAKLAVISLTSGGRAMKSTGDQLQIQGRLVCTDLHTLKERQTSSEVRRALTTLFPLANDSVLDPQSLLQNMPFTIIPPSKLKPSLRVQDILYSIHPCLPASLHLSTRSNPF